MVKNPPANVGDTGDAGLIPGLGRSPGEGNGNSLQYCLENPMDRGAWWAIVHGVIEESDTTEQQSHTHTNTLLNFHMANLSEINFIEVSMWLAR